MRIHSIFVAAALVIAASGQAVASDLKPVQYQSIDLGGVAGNAYYTVERDGFHVVATFAQRNGITSPVRFKAVLSPGQAVTFSTPRSVGEQPVSFSIRRQDERVVVSKDEFIN